VGDVQVWAVGSSGARTPVSLTGFTPDPEAPGAYMLVGMFTPSEAGRLHITGHDLDEHFPRAGGPTGDELDSDPATCARATWGNAADGAPYPFTGFESGPDTHHAFKIEGECVTGPIRADLVNSYRWGTWRGTIRFTRIDTGPSAGRADVTNEVTLRAALSLPGDLGAVGQALYGGVNPVAVAPHSFTGIGHVRGTFRIVASGGLAHWAGAGTVVDAGGVVGLRAGSPGERCEYGWFIKYNDDLNRAFGNTEGIQGETCVDGNISGRSVERIHPLIAHEKSWSFHFVPSDPPPHVPMLLKHIEESEPVHRASSDFSASIAQILAPAYQAPSARGGAAGTQAYTAGLMKIGELTSKMRAFDGLSDAYDDRFADACKAWLSSAPDADAEYQQALDGFRQAYDEYRRHLHGLEAELAGLVDALASQVDSVSPAAAQKLRQTSQKLREKGMGAFGTR
jgi:hypothetical protein